MARWASTIAASSPSTASKANAPRSDCTSGCVSSVICTHPRFHEGATETAEPRSDPALDRSFRLAEDLGHLTVGPPTEVGELDGLALAGGDRAECLTYVVGHGEVPRLVLDVVAALGREARLAVLAS